MIVYHVALPADWAHACQVGRYTVSTRGVSLAQQGFIHAATAAQWPVVRHRFYAGVPVVLLSIDTDLLEGETRWEPGEPGSQELFPHLYCEVPVEAVLATRAIPD